VTFLVRSLTTYGVTLWSLQLWSRCRLNAHNGPGDTPELGRNPDADPVQIHRDYVERRIGGGAAPTSDAYGRALEEFHKLPGAVRQPAAEAWRPRRSTRRITIRLWSPILHRQRTTRSR